MPTDHGCYAILSPQKYLWLLGSILLIVVLLAWRVDESFIDGWDLWLLGGDRTSTTIRTGQTLFGGGKSEKNQQPAVLVTRQPDAASSITKVADLAWSMNHSYYCGEQHQQATEITQVAAQFGRLEPYYLVTHEEEEEDLEISSGTRTIVLPFHAYDGNGTQRTLGGDEFVVTISGWSESNQCAWKTAVVARDYGNGTYAALLRVSVDILPSSSNSVRVTLLHYYSCYQGFTRPGARAPGEFLKLNLGPVPVEPSPTLAQLLEQGATNSSLVWRVSEAHIRDGVVMLESLPDCPANQLGMDQLSWGIWVFPSSPSPDIVDTNCTRKAVWVPTVCRPPRVVNEGDRLRLVDRTSTSETRTSFQFFRVGDSTMPPAGGNRGTKWNIGDPFLANYKNLIHHDVYIDILKHGVSQADALDVLVLSHGLHQIQNGPHNVERAVESVLRMLCQLGTVFPGKLLVQAPVPIQQQLFAKVDLTDTNVNLFKARMREKITSVDSRLADICRDVQLDIFYCAATDSGDFATPAKVLQMFEENFQYTPELNATSDEQELLHYFRELSASDRESIWGDRRVLYADVAHLLRARPECYRDHDKIHALRIVDGQYLMDFGHGMLLQQYAALRGSMEG